MARRALVAVVFISFALALGSLRPSAAQAVAPIKYFIADGAGQAGFRPSDRQLAQWAFEAWQRSSAGGVRFEAAAESSALIRLYWAGSDPGSYGEMRPLIVDGQRGAAVYIYPDVDALGEDIARRTAEDALFRDSIVYLTCVHELGHALGFPHTMDFLDIMYFFGYGGDFVQYFDRYRIQLRSRSDIGSVAGLSDADINRLKSKYGGR